MTPYSEAIRAAIKRSKIPIRTIAKKAEISEMTIYQIWGSDKSPRLDTLLRIMNALGIKSLDELLGIGGESQQKDEDGMPLLLYDRPVGIVRSVSGSSVEAIINRRYCSVLRSDGSSGRAAVEIIPV